MTDRLPHTATDQPAPKRRRSKKEAAAARAAAVDRALAALPPVADPRAVSWLRQLLLYGERGCFGEAAAGRRRAGPAAKK
jgi:hypothetical protein